MCEKYGAGFLEEQFTSEQIPGMCWTYVRVCRKYVCDVYSDNGMFI